MDKQLWGADPVNGRSKWVPLDHYGPKSYVTGGETWPTQSVYGGPSSVGLNGTQAVLGSNFSESGTYYVVPIFGGNAADKGSITLKWYVTATPGTQVAANTDLSAEVIRFLVVGG